MKKLFLILALLIFSLYGSTQVFQEIKTNRVILTGNGVLRPLRDTVILNARDSASIAYKNGKYYGWSGYKYNSFGFADTLLYSTKSFTQKVVDDSSTAIRASIPNPAAINPLTFRYSVSAGVYVPDGYFSFDVDNVLVGDNIVLSAKNIYGQPVSVFSTDLIALINNYYIVQQVDDSSKYLKFTASVWKDAEGPSYTVISNKVYGTGGMVSDGKVATIRSFPYGLKTANGISAFENTQIELGGSLYKNTIIIPSGNDLILGTGSFTVPGNTVQSSGLLLKSVTDFYALGYYNGGDFSGFTTEVGNVKVSGTSEASIQYGPYNGSPTYKKILINSTGTDIQQSSTNTAKFRNDSTQYGRQIKYIPSIRSFGTFNEYTLIHKKYVDSLYSLSSGTGSVTSISTTNGILGGTITATGTLEADTSLLSTKAFSQKIVGDSSAAIRASIPQNTTASNGLTKVGNDIQLGGVLTSPVIIGGGTPYSLTISDSLIYTRDFFRSILGQPSRGFRIGIGASGLDSGSVYVGYRAGDSLTTGRDNSFVGYKAGERVSTGSFNTFYGHRAGRSVTTGNDNTGFGWGALELMNSGLQHTAVGYSPGAILVAGNGTSLFGYGAASITKYAQYDVIVGMYAARVHQNLFENVALGYRSLYGAAGALSDADTLSKNVGVGAYTGYLNLFGDRNIFIGHSAGYNETGSDKLYIENSNSSTPLIGGDFAADTLRFNGKVSIEQVDSINTPQNILYITQEGRIQKAAIPVGGGSGTVTSVATGFGLQGGTITTTGTLESDTASMSTRARGQKGIDSLGAIKQNNITLTTTGNSGVATFSSGTLNIPNYGAVSSLFSSKGSLTAASGFEFCTVKPISGTWETADKVLKIGHASNDNERTITINAMLYKNGFDAGIWTEVATLPSGYRPSALITFPVTSVVPGTSNTSTTPIRGSDGTTGIIDGCVYQGAAGYIDADGKIFVRIISITSIATIGGTSVILLPINITYFINPGS